MSATFTDHTRLDELITKVAAGDYTDKEFKELDTLAKAKKKSKDDRVAAIASTKQNLTELAVSISEIFTLEDAIKGFGITAKHVLTADDLNNQDVITSLFTPEAVKAAAADLSPKAGRPAAKKSDGTSKPRAKAVERASSKNEVLFIITKEPGGVGKDYSYNKGRVHEPASDVVSAPWAPAGISDKLLTAGISEKTLTPYFTAEGKAYFATPEGKKELAKIIEEVGKAKVKVDAAAAKKAASAPATAAA